MYIKIYFVPSIQMEKTSTAHYMMHLFCIGAIYAPYILERDGKKCGDNRDVYGE
jgi:hypothetical protein